MSFADIKPTGAPPVSPIDYPFIVSPVAPGNPHQGMGWIDSSTTALAAKVYDAGAWKAISAKHQWVATPTDNTDPGTAGQMAYDATHIYVCVAADTWIRFKASHEGGW